VETILILENENNLRTLYKEELEDEGYHILLAKSGEGTLEILEKKLSWFGSCRISTRTDKIPYNFAVYGKGV